MIASIKFYNPSVLLDQFAEMVDEERLGKRIPYKEWRRLKDIFSKIQTDMVQYVYAKPGIATNQIEFGYVDMRDNGGYIIDLYNSSDDSFGTFLGLMLAGTIDPWEELVYTTTVSNDYTKISDSTHNKTVTYDYNDNDIAWTKATIATSKSDSATKAIDYHCSTAIGVIDYNPDSTPAVYIEGDLIVKGKIINDNKERESNNMKFNFDFGSCENDNVRVSPYGIAVKNSDSTWVSYDAKSGNLIDVDVFNFDGGKYLFKMPVAVKDIKVGDTVIHNRVPVYVVSVADGDITVIDPRAGDKKTILPLTNMFNFNFVTKVVSLLDGAFGTATADQPFGNMLPFFLMSNSKGNDVDPLMMAMMLNGNAAGGLQNPMMLALLCADQTNMKDVLPLMMLSGQFTPAAK